MLLLKTVVAAALIKDSEVSILIVMDVAFKVNTLLLAGVTEASFNPYCNGCCF